MSDNPLRTNPYRGINLNRDTRKRLRCHALMVGEISNAWNNLHVEFWRLFITVFGRDREEAARSLWNSGKQDASQRNMLLGLCEGNFGGFSPIFEEIYWAAQITEILGRYRNALFHTLMISSISDGQRNLTPFTREGNPHGQRIKEIYDKRLVYKMRGDLEGLKNFIGIIEVSLLSTQCPLPNRPLLKALPDQYDTALQKTQERLRKARNAQPRS